MQAAIQGLIIKTTLILILTNTVMYIKKIKKI
jgi:hypothetical protein